MFVEFRGASGKLLEFSLELLGVNFDTWRWHFEGLGPLLGLLGPPLGTSWAIWAPPENHENSRKTTKSNVFYVFPNEKTIKFIVTSLQNEGSEGLKNADLLIPNCSPKHLFSF